MCHFISFSCKVKFCGMLLFVICKLQCAVGEKGVWNTALIFATFFPAFSPDSNWCPFVYTGSLFASKYSEYENQQLCSSDTED